MPLLVLSFLLSLMSTFALAIDYGHATVSKFIRAYDGDTITVNIKGWPKIIGKEVRVRIAGIDTPEIRGQSKREKELALEAKRTVEHMLSSAKRIKLKHMRRGKYFRIVADVIADGIDIGQHLIKTGQAVRYDGGTQKKTNWSRR